MRHRLTLAPQDHARIADAIRNAETRTTGEIVCVLARSSDSYFYPAAFALALGVLAASLAAAIAVDSRWWMLSLWHFVVLQITAYGALLVVIAFFPSARIHLVPKSVRYRRAHRNALAQFLSRNIHVTEHRTGVLIFVSLAERYAEIVADAGIDARVPQSVWDDIVAALVDHAASGNLIDGYVTAVSSVADILAREFPGRVTDANELSDHLVEL